MTVSTQWWERERAKAREYPLTEIAQIALLLILIIHIVGDVLGW